MPKVYGHTEVLADDDDAVLGDSMTVTSPKRTRRRQQRAARYYRPQSPLAGDLGLPDGEPTQAIVPASFDETPLARTAETVGYVAGQAAKGAIVGGVYGALLGNGSTERRIGGGAAGGAVAFPVLKVVADFAKRKMAERSGQNPIAEALLDDAAHVGGAAASVAAAGGEAADGAIAGAGVCLAAHVLGWVVRGIGD